MVILKVSHGEDSSLVKQCVELLKDANDAQTRKQEERMRKFREENGSDEEEDEDEDDEEEA